MCITMHCPGRLPLLLTADCTQQEVSFAGAVAWVGREGGVALSRLEGPFVGRFRLEGNMGLVIGRAKEGEGGNCKQQGAAKQVAGKREGADNLKIKTSKPKTYFTAGLQLLVSACC